MNAMKYVGKTILLGDDTIKVVSVMPRRDGWAKVRAVGKDRQPRHYDMTEAVLKKARAAYLQALVQA